MANETVNEKKIITSEIEWLMARQRGIGSSDSPVLALAPEEVFGKGPIDLYISKKATPKTQPDNVDFRRGHAYEPLALLLAEKKMGMKIFSPKNDHERWNDFRVEDPNRPWIYGDFDGLREDGWVVEVKSPRQRNADLIRNIGLKKYYMVQGQHLVHVASEGILPFLGKLPNGCPGVCFVIYEPENVEVQIYEIPREDSAIAAIVSNATKFWKNHVERNEPPASFSGTRVAFKPQKTEYKEISGPAWDEALRQYLLCKEQELGNKKRSEIAKQRIIDSMIAIGHDKIIVNGKHKFSNSLQKGRKLFDRKAFEAAHPEIDLSQFDAEGAPFSVFRHYGPKDELKWGDETIDGQLLTLKEELSILGKRSASMGVEEVVEFFDELKARSELYVSTLNLEIESIQKELSQTTEKVIENMTGGKGK